MTATAQPEIINVLGFVEEIRRQHEQQPDAPFLFILGAGASRSSGIKTGGEMVRVWLQELYALSAARDKVSLAEWLRSGGSGISELDPSDPAAAYPYVYQRRYGSRPKAGHAFLESEMRDARPSYGYTVLAQILASTKHNVVVTTNFDNLVADSLLLCSTTYPLICGHEALARFASTSSSRPTVLKVHRDVLLDPKNTESDLRDLEADFKPVICDLLQRYTPIVIGYGGNDGSLMGLLEGLEPGSLQNSLYWCYRTEDGLPRDRILRLVDKHRGALVPIPDFDLVMFLLGKELRMADPHAVIKEKVSKHLEALERSHEDLSRRAMQNVIVNSSSSDVSVLAGLGASIAVLRSTEEPSNQHKPWWKWVEDAKKEPEVEKRAAIYEAGLAALPDDAKLLGAAASYFHRGARDFDRAEQLFVAAIAADPENTVNLSNFGEFLANVRHDNARAQDMFERAFMLDPRDSTNLTRLRLLVERMEGAEGLARLQARLFLDPMQPAAAEKPIETRESTISQPQRPWWIGRLERI